MKVLSVFQDMASVRLHRDHKIRVSIGATVIIKCDMDFDLYPLDVQKCAVDFSSYKYTYNEMKFRWQDDPALSFPSDFSTDGYRLPRYVVSFKNDENMHVIFYGEGNHSTARMIITMSREIRSHLIESYLPSSLFVIISWGSFIVIPEVVPGRMVLLVTTLLSLVTMFDTVRNNSPSALELKCIEVWIISCTLFVFLALMEYFIVLFGIRYDKHWRQRKGLERIAAINNHNVTNKDEHSKLFINSKIQPQSGDTQNTEQKTDKNLPREEFQMDTVRETKEIRVLPAREKFKLVTEHVLLYAGSQRGMMDQVSLGLFPLCFVIFAITYWVSYLNEARRRAGE
ncbi:glycine receptor subunit alpha-2-like [Lycorma delicatula]|uniref:glycine receptor subunit alpha-2-like n=1 Tax=Lycorma delicatula TaxID=130591 RepID=UPI003F50E2B9